MPFLPAITGNGWFIPPRKIAIWGCRFFLIALTTLNRCFFHCLNQQRSLAGAHRTNQKRPTICVPQPLSSCPISSRCPSPTPPSRGEWHVASKNGTIGGIFYIHTQTYIYIYTHVYKCACK